MSSARQKLAGTLGLAVAATGLSFVATPGAVANPIGTGLVISEVYGGGGFAATDTLPASSYKADFIELYNPTDAPISLNGLAVFYGSATRANGGNLANKTALTGQVAPHSHYLIAQSGTSNGDTALPAADATGTINLSGSSGLVVLSDQATMAPPTGDISAVAGVIDAVGYGTANTFEGAADGTTTSGTTSAARAANGADSNNNATDFTVGPPTPVACGAACAAPAPLAATSPGNRTGVLNQPITPFTITASGGTAPYTWSATGLPAGVTINTTTGEVSGTPTAAGTFSVTVTATDSASTPATDSETFTMTISDGVVVKTIAEIQGTGARSPYAPATGTGQGTESVTTEGVVTAMYRTGGFNGMYIQTGGTGGATDATPGASDAIFVWGNSSMPDGVAIGDSVRVTGTISEFGSTSSNPESLTELTPSAGGVVELASPLPAVTAAAIAYPATNADREAHEGELIQPTDTFTVTNAYNMNTFAEIGLARGTTPLIQPTEVCKDDDTACLAAKKADNAARAVALDDGASVNYMTNETAQDQPLPWLTPTRSVRVGAQATFNEPVVLDYRNSTWKFQPRQQLTGTGESLVTITDTRPANAAPANVDITGTSDIKIATFNVLNYFNTTGQQYVATGAAQSPPVNTQCTFYTDRNGTPIANNTCGIVTNGVNAGNGPRGAATAESLARQEAKIVTAINGLGADIVGLQEVENSIKLVAETDRDDALRQLVEKLNAAAGAGTWKYVHSPAEATTSTNVGFQDVIRPAFIYKPAKVRPVGQSDIYFEQSFNANATTGAPAGAFANAREPLAQAFKRTGALDSDAFAVVLNHFKSKGDSDPAATGDNANSPDTGAFNGDRVRQAQKLVEFANAFAAARGVQEIFLAGDFNSYTEEDPMHVMYDAGFHEVEVAEESYSFSGLSGSLDHVLANAAGMAMVTGADVWDINASEPIAYQYSRYNYNATQFFDSSNPFAASDHNPEIVGLDLPEPASTYTEIQLIGTNDFHGRLLADGANAAGAAVLAGAVKELRADNPKTVFVAAGDLVGASTFESFIQDDDPTIEALNEAGLDVSAVGNHEFDQGYEDLVTDIMAAANWEYLATNVTEPAGRDELAETWTASFDVGGQPFDIGFVGAVTEDLPSLVSPAGIQGVTVQDIVDSTNAAAAELKANGAELVVLLVHEGSPVTSCSSPNFTDPSTVWGNITQNTSANVDAIVSGHTHLAYNCEFTVQQWVNEGRAVTKRPVVSAGQYGTFLNQLVFTVDNATGKLVAKSQDVIGLVGTGYAPDPTVAQTVADAKAQADVLGAQPLGKIQGAFNRAKLANGTTENRGGESTLGNLVAEIQRWATSTPEAGSAQIAFMNPGGLRTDLVGGITGEGAYPKTVTYRQAAEVQPFANTLVNMDLTGAQIKKVLEQQWQRDAAGAVPSRPFLRLGVSKGFTYTFDPTRPEGDRITGMWLNGAPIAAASTYSVTVNSFLASGGDNFREFANGTSRADTGKVDLQAQVDYMKEFAKAEAPLAVDYSQRAVGVSFPAGAPTSYAAGQHVVFDVSSWTMSTAADVKDTAVTVKVGDVVLGTAPLDNTIGTAVFDDYGTAHVDVVVPAGVNGTALTLVGTSTGTTVTVPVTIAGGGVTPAPIPQQPGSELPDTVEVLAPSIQGNKLSFVLTADGVGLTGEALVQIGSRVVSMDLVNGVGTVKVRKLLRGVPVKKGKVKAVITYVGDSQVAPFQTTVKIRVGKRR